MELTPSLSATPGQQVQIHAQASGYGQITNISAIVNGKAVTLDNQGDGKSTTTKITKITVNNRNAAPEFEIPSEFIVQEEREIRFRAKANDPDNPGFVPQDKKESGKLTELEGSDPSVTHAIANKPETAKYDSDTGMFVWTPGFNEAGIYNVKFIATDDGNGTGNNLTTEKTVRIRVLDTNRFAEIVQQNNLTL